LGEIQRNLISLFPGPIPTQLDTAIYDKFEGDVWLLPSAENISKVYSKIKMLNLILSKPDGDAFRQDDLWMNLKQEVLALRDLLSSESNGAKPFAPRAEQLTDSKEFTIFVAYDDGLGHDLAKHLKQELEERQHSSFVAFIDIPPEIRLGEKWQERINKVLSSKSCNSFVLIMSADKLSPEVTRETRLAFDRNKRDPNFSILICHMDGMPRQDEQLSAAGISARDYQQIDFDSVDSKYDLARKVISTLDKAGAFKKDQRQFTAQSVEVRAESNRLYTPCAKILNPVLLLPFVFAFSLGCFSLYFYAFNGQSMAAFWFGYAQTILVLLGLVWSLSIAYVYREGILGCTVSIPDRGSVRSIASRIWRKCSSPLLIKGAILLVLVGAFVPITDARFGILSPRVDYVVTQYPVGYSVVGSVSNYRVVFQVNKKYFIDSPVLWTTQSIVIPNPSNYSYSSACPNSYYGYYTGSVVLCGVITASLSDAKAELVSQTNATGSIKSFEVILTQTPQPYTSILSMSYDDAVTSKPVVASYSTPMQSGPIYYQLINITLSDPLQESVSIGYNQFQIGRYGDILDISCARDGVVTSVGCTSNSTSTLWLWLQELRPGQTISFALNVTYSGAVYT